MRYNRPSHTYRGYRDSVRLWACATIIIDRAGTISCDTVPVVTAYLHLFTGNPVDRARQGKAVRDAFSHPVRRGLRHCRFSLRCLPHCHVSNNRTWRPDLQPHVGR